MATHDYGHGERRAWTPRFETPPPDEPDDENPGPFRWVHRAGVGCAILGTVLGVLLVIVYFIEMGDRANASIIKLPIFFGAFGWGVGLGIGLLSVPRHHLESERGQKWLRRVIGTRRVTLARVVAVIAVLFFGAFLVGGGFLLAAQYFK